VRGIALSGADNTARTWSLVGSVLLPQFPYRFPATLKASAQNSHWNVTVLLTEVPLSAPTGNPTPLVRSRIRTAGRWYGRERKVPTSSDRSGKS
jgi:hypothetical protein